MGGTVNQRDQTRNQSTADFSFGHLFLFDNRFKEGVLKNGPAESVHKGGSLIMRNGTKFAEITSADDLDKVIGISAQCGETTLQAAQEIPINVCTKGTVDGNLLVFPAGVTLETSVGDKLLTDILEDLGLHIDTSGVENTKHDN